MSRMNLHHRRGAENAEEARRGRQKALSSFFLSAKSQRFQRLRGEVDSCDSYFHDFIFFVFGEVADLGHVLVGQFLHVVQPASLFVF